MVNVKLPRFRIEATRNLEEEIRGLGVDAIFQPGVADFSNMVRRNLINLSQFRHRCSNAITHLKMLDMFFYSGVFQGKYWGKGVGQTWHQCFQSKAKSWNLEAEIFWGIVKNHAQVWDSKVALYVMLSQLMSWPVVHTGWTAKSSTRQLLQYLITISSVCYCLLRTYWCLTRLTEPSSTLSGITSRAQSSSLVASPGLLSCDCLGQPALPAMLTRYPAETHIKGLF